MGAYTKEIKEDVSSYDEAQNSKLMCDCLKTLCEIYDELRGKGSQCPHEAEFRSYQLLMLMDGETFGQNLRDLLRLPAEVKTSPFITFAKKVGIAFHTKDFYSYLKLFREASYPQRCILHKVRFFSFLFFFSSFFSLYVFIVLLFAVLSTPTWLGLRRCET